MDIILLQYPNKTMEIAPLGTSMLVSSLKENGFQAKQYDMNVELKDGLLKEYNLNLLYTDVIPFLLKMDLTDKYYKSVLALYKILKQIDQMFSFATIEYVKSLLQQREYLTVFENDFNTNVFELILKILSLSTSLFDVLISNEIIEEKFSNLFFFTMIDENLQAILEQKPRVIGLSVVQMQRRITIWVCNRLRQKYSFQGILLFGGSDVTYYKERYLANFDCVNYAIYQEGELALTKFLEYLNGMCTVNEVPNLIYRHNGKILINPSITPCNFDEIIPDFDDLNLDLYLTHALPMQISRGCSWGLCTYCKHFRTYGEKYYAGKVENSVEVISTLMQKYDTNLFHFVDDDFPRLLKKEFCENVIERGIDIKWLTYSRLDDKITYDDLLLWYRAGLRVVEWGLESASQKVLDSVNKGIQVEKIKSLLFQANDIGLLNKLFMFHNLPYENYDDLYTSIQFLKKFVRHGIVRAFWEISTPLELLEGTILYEQAKKETLFTQVFQPRGLLEVKAGYQHKCNYQIKQDIFNKELEDEEKYYKEKGILNVNDEAIMFDIIIEELSHEHSLYAKVR